MSCLFTSSYWSGLVTTPFLPELVQTNHVQNVSLALDMLPPIGLLPAHGSQPIHGPQLVHDQQPVHVPQPPVIADDLCRVNADLRQPVDASDPRQAGAIPRTSNRLKKPNSKYSGEPWN